MANKNETFLVYAKRTPVGKLAGALAAVRVDDLLANLMKDAVTSMKFDPKEIDDVIVGCANQAGEDNRNIARMSLLIAGLPLEVPGTTVNRLCGSSLDALIYAYSRISSGQDHCILVGGAEGMSRAPYVLSKADSSYSREQVMYDTALGWRFPNPKMKEKYPLFSMGETAEEVASLHKISREDQDQFAYNSHQKAISAQKAGLFADEILPVEIVGKKQTTTVTQDEGPRADTSLEKLASLNPAFRKGGTVTAGNSSSLNDGAAVVLAVSGEFLKRHSLKPIARISGAGVRGCHPNTMGLGPIFASHLLCERYGKKITDFDRVEINEAFAAQVLACARELKIPLEKLNLQGGGISLGHPLGMSGARLATTMFHQMKRDSKIKQALLTMCIGMGQGIAVSLENCS